MTNINLLDKIEKGSDKASNDRLVSMTEKSYAQYLASKGINMIFNHNHYWKKTNIGFYEPIHWLSRLNAEQINKPALLCWGFRAALSQQDVGQASGSIPIHLLKNFQNYDLQSLPRKRRNRVKKGYKNADIVRVKDCKFLREKGYDVFLSASKRTAYESPLSEEEYWRTLPSLRSNTELVLAGLSEGKLGGYVVGHAVERTAYIHDVRIATESLSSCVGLALIFEFIQVCRRSKNIDEIVYGLHSREDSALCSFKESLGFSVHHIPTYVKIQPLAARIIKSYYPHKYYRLTGDE